MDAKSGGKQEQQLWHELMARKDGAVMQAQSTVAREIEDVLAERNLKGQDLSRRSAKELPSLPKSYTSP